MEIYEMTMEERYAAFRMILSVGYVVNEDVIMNASGRAVGEISRDCFEQATVIKIQDKRLEGLMNSLLS